MKDYVIFLSSQQKLAEHKQSKLSVIDLNTLEHMDVLAVVSSLQELPDADRLWIRVEDVGDVRKSREPWSIKILERKSEAGEAQDAVLPNTNAQLNEVTKYISATSEQYLRDIIATSDQWVWEMDTDGRYTYVSSSVEKILGYKQKEIVGKTFFDFLAKEDIQFTERFFQQCKQNQAGFKSFSHRKRHREGRNIWAEATGFPVVNKDSHLRGWRGVEQDVTKRKEIEEKFYLHHQLLAVLNTLNNTQIIRENLNWVIANIARRLREIIAADKVTIFLPPLDSNEICLPSEPSNSRTGRIEPIGLPREKGFKEEIFSFVEPAFLGNFKGENGLRSFIAPNEEGACCSLLNIPLRGQEGILGVIELTQMEPNGFRHVDLALMDALGVGIGLFIERTCYYATLQDREKDLRLISARLIHAQEDEKHRISRILHDDFGQFLGSANMVLKSAEIELTSCPEVCKDHLQEASALIRKAARRARDLSFELRPMILETIGLIPALNNLASHYQDLMKAKLEFRASDFQERLPGNIELAFYRVAEEALRNASRYAKARNIVLELRQFGKRFALMLEDDGVGFENQKVRFSAKGLGLNIMEERMTSIGGEFKVISQPNKGTTVMASFTLGGGKNGNESFHCG